MSAETSGEPDVTVRRSGRMAFAVLFVLLLLGLFVTGGSTLTSTTTTSTGVVNVVTVAAFVGIMLAVAFSIIGGRNGS